MPTRALAADLFRCFDTIASKGLGLGMAIRTSDLKTDLSGFSALMLTTPESPDVMLGGKNSDEKRFIAGIEMVVVSANKFSPACMKKNASLWRP